MFLKVGTGKIVDRISLPDLTIEVTKRRLALLGAGALSTVLLNSSSAYAEGMPIINCSVSLPWQPICNYASYQLVKY